MNVNERVKITSRALKLLGEYCPGLMRTKALTALFDSAQPFYAIWLSAKLVGEIAGARDLRAIIIYALALILGGFALSLLKGVLNKLSETKEQMMWSHFRKIFSDKQLKLDYADIERASVQAQKQRAEENLFMFGNGMGQLVWSTTGLIGAFVNIMCSVSLTISLFTARAAGSALSSPYWAIPVIACALISCVFSAKATDNEYETFDMWVSRSVWFQRALSFYGRELFTSSERAKDVRIYRQHALSSEAFKGFAQADKANNDLYIRRMCAYSALSNVFSGVLNVLNWLFVALKAYAGAFGAGYVLQYVGALGRFGEGARGMMFSYKDNAASCKHLKSLFEFLDIPSQTRDGALPAPAGRLTIEFRNVNFRYPGADAWALKNISLTINQGEKLAIVGMNGSGKTTLVKLLCRLYEPTAGEILLNGVSISAYDYDAYISLICVVFQDFKLLSFPLGENVAASIEFDPARANECLRAAGFGERLESMPDGLNTYLYKDFCDKGVDISGGEAQKIALARALYRNAPIMVLDEPTAALDPIAEFEVFSEFNALTSGKSAIFISHRLASCRLCDNIAVFHQGELIQLGAHAELITQAGGKYAQLYNAQARYYARTRT